jgi:hypothetical protein
MDEYHDDSTTKAIVELVRAWSVSPFDSSEPASEEEIAEAERELGVAFPRSYRVFLRYFGAASLYGYEIYGLPSDRL